MASPVADDFTALTQGVRSDAACKTAAPTGRGLRLDAFSVVSPAREEIGFEADPIFERPAARADDPLIVRSVFLVDGNHVV